jgi:hypothetical protein
MPTVQEIQAFVMPSVGIGETVVWYRHGTRNSQHEIATVYKRSARNVHLLTATNGVREGVRHIDDPKLQLNPEQREMGAWDTSEFNRDLQAQIADMQDDLKELKRGMAAMIAKPKAKPVVNENGGFAQYRRLLEKAESLGIAMEGRPKKDWLVEQIALKEQE